MRKIWEKAKTVIILLLAILMIALWIYYIDLQFDRTRNGEEVEPELERSFWVYTDAATVPDDVTANESFFSPSSVSLILSDSGHTSAHSTQLTHALWESTKPLISEIFSSHYVCEPAEAEDWEKALGVSDGILVEFASPLPYTSITLFVQRTDDHCLGELCFVDKLLLFSDSSNALTALSTDSNGGVYRYTLADSSTPAMVYDFNSNNLAAYTVNEGLIEFEFNRSKDGTKRFKGLDGDLKLLRTPLSLEPATFVSPLADTIEAADGDTEYLELVSRPELAGLLEAFDVNPNIVGYYSDKGSGLNFVGQDMRLTVKPDGTVEYSVNDGADAPITASSLLNTAGSVFNSGDILCAATVFLDRFHKSMLGGDGEVILEDISYNGADLVVSFGYYYRLTDIVIEDKTPSISLTFNGSGLVSARIFPLGIYPAEEGGNGDGTYLTADIIPYVAAHMTDGKGSLEPVYPFTSYGDVSYPIWAKNGKEDAK